eukprot:Em0005g425a
MVLCSYVVMTVDTTDVAWQQAQLSLSRGGLGMRSLSLHSPAAFIASLCSSGYGSPSNHHLSDAIQKFNESVSPSNVIQSDGLVLSTVHQNQLSSKIDIHQFNNILIISSVADKACLLSVLSPHAASWLTVVPSEGLGLHLLPSVFQVAVKWWLGLDTSNGFLCALCPNNALDPLGHHATTCKEGGDVVTRHNQLRNVLAETCRIAHLSVKVEMGSNLTSEHDHSRPADILLPNWALGKPAAFDISVTSPLNPKIVSVAGLSAGAAALSTEERKHTENDPKCNAFGWCCVPLVTESYGAWGKEAMDSFKMLASRLAIISGKPKSVVLSELYSRLNLHLVRANATAILSREHPHRKRRARALARTRVKLRRPYRLQTTLDLGELVLVARSYVTWWQRFMAQIRLETPPPLDFTEADAWPQWKKRFEQFRVASGLCNEDESRQVSTLLYCLGEGAEEVLQATATSLEKAKKQYREAIETFEIYFRVKRNVIYERARFNSRNQLEGEPVEQYVLSLHSLARNCEYGTLQEELIRDRIVIGIRDKALSRRLQLDADLTLEKAMRLVRQNEAVGEQQKVLQGNLEYKKESLVRQNETVGGQQKESAESVDLDKVGVSSEHRGGEKRKCSRCGREHGANGRCPAQNAVCFGCKRKGHFRSMCRSNSISEMTPDTEEAESCEGAVYLDEEVFRRTGMYVNVQAIVERPELHIIGRSTSSIEDQRKFIECRRQCMQQMGTKLFTSEGLEITDVLRFFHGDGPAQQFEAGHSIGGNYCCVGCGARSTLFDDIVHCYRSPKLSFKDRQEFVLKGASWENNNATPFDGLSIEQLRVELARRCIDIKGKKRPQLDKDFEELKMGIVSVPALLQTNPTESLESLNLVQYEVSPLEPLHDIKGHFSNVIEESICIAPEGSPELALTTLSERGAWIVVAPKRNGDIRICVDLKALNESVLREVYPLPTVDETLAQLTGATVFSKLDANSGFWQIPLADSSRLLTTFITPFGRYCFNKLPFVFGSNQQEHDFRLHAILKAIKAAGVTLNSEKCSFSVDKLKFLGHVISRDGVSADPDKTKAILQMKPPTNITELRRFMGMGQSFFRNLKLSGDQLCSHPDRCLKQRLEPLPLFQKQIVKYSRMMPNFLQLNHPQALQEETRQSLHQGHQGIQRCQLRASSCVWWPGISKDLERFVKQCLVCAKRSVPCKEPMIPSELPKYPWQKVGTDLFEMKGATFLLVVDYFSRYVETTKLASTTSSAVITALKSIFARFGVPEIVVSDNGPQFVSKEMKEFSELYRFQHTTSSPHYPQSNGQAERAVQTVKRLLSSDDDPYLTMLCYRATPLSWCGLSPAQLLMGRLIRTNIPQISEHLVPKWDFLGTFREKHQQYKVKMKCNYDESHCVQSRSEIPIGTDVWVSSGGNNRIRGKVTSSANTPRSCIVETPSGEVRRTREHLVPVPEETHVGQKSTVVSQEEPAVDERSNYSTPSSPIASRTRLKTGVSIRPPQRL